MAIKSSWIVAGVLGLALAGGGGWIYKQRGAGEVVPAETIVKVQKGTLEVVVAETGRIQPLTKVDVKSKVAGQVSLVRVKEGQTVKKGDVLLELDPTDFKRNLAQVQADRDMVAAELAGLRAGARREEVAEARAMATQARVRAKRADEDRTRAKQALAAGSLTPREWEMAKAEADESAAALRAAESKVALLVAGARPAEVAQAQARLKKADVALQAARDQLANTALRSPIAGTVIYRSIQPGELVTPGVAETGVRGPLLTVADLSRLIIESELNQIDVGKLRVGLPVTIRVDTLPGETFKGTVNKVAPAAVAGRERDVQMFPVETLVAPTGVERLRPGMSVDLDIFITRRPDVLLLPIQAVVRERGRGGTVTVVQQVDGRWSKEKRPVTLGMSSDQQVEVASGLNEGEQVQIDPLAATGNVNQF